MMSLSVYKKLQINGYFSGFEKLIFCFLKVILGVILHFINRKFLQVISEIMLDPMMACL